ncbi:hypothetical protein [Conexibacter sp. CPCC 206217]|uniref:hypothetical protein n=1 Tax=Conexibacter sp. CPCC 206217 TaxID=3064574 RepID=UPI002716A957|nr:hypothetical protein [Conexibacter sp. CPCC 206217]MDO8211104.1 hypothetical protein [Conexibacter sp. CPCC 206217]
MTSSLLRAIAALVAAAAVALSFAAAPAALAGDWTVAEISGPAGTRWIQPNAVNAHGVVVGKAYFPGRADMTAFRWEDGTMIELATGGATRSEAYDVNDAGVIVGNAGDNGAVWTATRDRSALSLTAHNISGRYGSYAFGINERGQIAGSAGDTGTIPAPWDDDYDNRFPALTSGGGWSRLPMPDVITDRMAQIIGGDAVQINENGLIMVGGANMSGRPRLSSGGVASATYDLVAGNQGFNDLGHMAGRTTADPNSNPFSARIWNGAGYVDVGAAQPRSRANAINNLDWVVGRAGTEDWQAEYRQVGNAWLWRPDAPPTPLLELGPTGWSYANALDVNDDGVIVGVGKHGSKEVGFMLSPASIAHRLSGTIWGTDGAPVAGAQLRIVNAAGQDVAPTVVSGADGRYETTLLRGDYQVSLPPLGAYAPDAGAGCTLIAVFTCGLGLRQNRVVDFYAVPGIPPIPGPGPRSPGGGDGGRGAGPAGRGAGGGRGGPAFRGPRAGATLVASRAGVVGFRLGPFSTAASGTVALQQAGAAPRGRRAAASAAAARTVALGSRSFRARAGRPLTVTITLKRAARRLLRQRRSIRAVAVVTARDAARNVTTKRFSVTVRAARAGSGRRGR